MPITANGLWGQIVDFDNLYQAYLEARRGKRDRSSVMRFAANVEENLAVSYTHLTLPTKRIV